MKPDLPAFCTWLCLTIIVTKFVVPGFYIIVMYCNIYIFVLQHHLQNPAKNLRMQTAKKTNRKVIFTKSYGWLNLIAKGSELSSAKTKNVSNNHFILFARVVCRRGLWNCDSHSLSSADYCGFDCLYYVVQKTRSVLQCLLLYLCKFSLEWKKKGCASSMGKLMPFWQSTYII